MSQEGKNIATLTGVIESPVRTNKKRGTTQFTLRTDTNDHFFIQAFSHRQTMCEKIKQGDRIVAITLPRSYKPKSCNNHHIYFELTDFYPVT